jgi:hypothetical protein
MIRVPILAASLLTVLRHSGVRPDGLNNAFWLVIRLDTR